MRNNFTEHNQKAANILRRATLLAPDAPVELKNFEHRCLIMLAPLVEIAWADGSIKAREMEAVFQVAETYGLEQDEDSYAELIDSMMTRATPFQIDQSWSKLHELLKYLPENERELLGFCLMMQARFVAEQRSNNSLDYLRGDQFSPDENEVLQKILSELDKSRQSSGKINSGNTEKRRAFEDAEFVEESFSHKPLSDQITELLPLVPLVKVAWAEGRITKREREFIFKRAEMLGIEPGTKSFQRLSDWLELHPTDEFYQESLERLRNDLTKLPEDERDLLHLDLLSDCVNIAEASGGTSSFAAGGPRICDEEIAAVKRIAQKIDLRNEAIAV